MTRAPMIPHEVLSQHIAVLGKTGSGKTSTAKLAIEQVVAGGARVCILDPIKSDWWGLTSSADGKKAGLPFYILGGPRGHVPLHASAGKAIAEIVANGALPLSIVDMADFEPGGPAKFFVDFVPTLLRKMRGVVYLVIEEAHLFAPKERSGIGQENLSIHWAKTMATAGRSKGIRLVVVSQRTQALHNAVLGSCDTLIAHRLTAPADQDPVIKWLKANTSKEVLDQVAGSLASLKTGEGWICSGEAKLFERVAFPRIRTYDNTATPTGDGESHEIKTAAVDHEKLRAIIGEAVDLAKADDPRELRKQIAEKNKRISELETAASGSARSHESRKQEVKPVLTDADRALLERVAQGLSVVRNELTGDAVSLFAEFMASIDRSLQATFSQLEGVHLTARRDFAKLLEQKGFQKILEKLATVSAPLPAVKNTPQSAGPRVPASHVGVGGSRDRARPAPGTAADDPRLATAKGLKKHVVAILTALAQHPLGRTREQTLILAGYQPSGDISTAFAGLLEYGWIAPTNTGIAITPDGKTALGPFEPLPTGGALRDQLLTGGRLASAERKLLAAAFELRERQDIFSRADLHETAALKPSGDTSTAIAKFLKLGWLVERDGGLTAADTFYED